MNEYDDDDVVNKHVFGHGFQKGDSSRVYIEIVHVNAARISQWNVRANALFLRPIVPSSLSPTFFIQNTYDIHYTYCFISLLFVSVGRKSLVDTLCTTPTVCKYAFVCVILRSSKLYLYCTRINRISWKTPINTKCSRVFTRKMVALCVCKECVWIHHVWKWRIKEIVK